jgi:hypothetical protein
VRVQRTAGAGQSDAIGQCRGRLGLVSLVAYTEGSQACLMAHFQRLAQPPPSCPSYHGHGETWDREGGLALGASPTDW